MTDSNHVRYIDKTRAYYQAAGYGTPDEWAHFDHTPSASRSPGAASAW